MKELAFAELAVYTCSCFNQLTHQKKDFFFAKTLENLGLTQAYPQKKFNSTALLSNQKKHFMLHHLDTVIFVSHIGNFLDAS